VNSSAPEQGKNYSSILPLSCNTVPSLICALQKT